MNVNDIPQELLDRIKLQFDAEPKVCEMRVQQQMLMRSGKYDKALELAERIEYLYNKCVYEYLAESEREAERVDVSTIDMSLEDKEDMLSLILSCYMCVEMMESSIIGMDVILHKYDKSLHVDAFDALRGTVETAETIIDGLSKNSDYMKDKSWYNGCDNIYRMVKNKAKAIMNKRKNDPKWGNGVSK